MKKLLLLISFLLFSITIYSQVKGLYVQGMGNVNPDHNLFGTIGNISANQTNFINYAIRKERFNYICFTSINDIFKLGNVGYDQTLAQQLSNLLTIFEMLPVVSQLPIQFK